MVAQIPTPLGRGSRILIVGCGDVGLRLAALLLPRFRVSGTCRDEKAATRLRHHAIHPVMLDLDAARARATTLVAPLVVHLAPPQSEGALDLRTRRLVAALRGVQRMVYISTSGVYGNCNGALIDETRQTAPTSDRARRRADAEQVLRDFARKQRVRLSILRVPGIYAYERLPVQRLANQTPVPEQRDQVYSNHIHADDLARIIAATLQRGRSMRVYHASDDQPLQVGDYFDQIADALGLARPPRMPREQLLGLLTPMQASFMQESRRLANLRLHQELRVELEYPTVGTFLAKKRDSLQ